MMEMFCQIRDFVIMRPKLPQPPNIIALFVIRLKCLRCYFNKSYISKIIKEYIRMQTAKGISQQYQFNTFTIQLTPLSPNKLELTVIDPLEKVQFTDKSLTLTNITTGTLMKALQNNMIEIKLTMKVNRTPDNVILQINVIVASQYLKPVEEVIYVKKTRDVSESEILKSVLTIISGKIKKVKDNDKLCPNIVRCGTVQQDQKTYNAVNNNFQQIASIRLPKGKHELTLSFMLHAMNSMLYLYFQKSVPMFPNGRAIFPTKNQYLPIIVRKSHFVNSDSEQVSFHHYYGQSYPVKFKNVILTAQFIDSA